MTTLSVLVAGQAISSTTWGWKMTMFMFFWTVINMAAIYCDIYVLDFTFTLYGDWFLHGDI